MRYKINWDKYLLNVVPYHVQLVRRMDWLKTLLKPFKTIWNTFLSDRSNVLQKMSHNGQVIYLQKVINDLYDANLRRIQIVDGDFANKWWLYWESENEIFAYLVNKFDQYANYLSGDRVLYNGIIYIAQVDAPGIPGVVIGEWLKLSDMIYLKNLVDYKKGFRFYVVIPSDLVVNIAALTSSVNYYRIAPMSWKIVYL